MQVRPVIFAVPAPPKGLPSRSLEVNRGRVKKDHPHFAEEVAPPIKERLLDQILRAARAAYCDTVREAKVVGGQKIMKMGRLSVKYPG
jgi:hypothetical protein